MNIEATVLELRDRVQITELMHVYCRHADNLDGVAMAELFVDDCIAQYVPGEGDTILRGRNQLTDMLTAALSNVISGSHHISNIEILFDDPDTATFCCYMYSWQRFDGYPSAADCHRWGRYENRFVRTAEGWKFSRLVLLSAGEYGGLRISEQLGRVFPPVFA